MGDVVMGDVIMGDVIMGDAILGIHGFRQYLNKLLLLDL